MWEVITHPSTLTAAQLNDIYEYLYPMRYGDVITYPCPILDAVFANLCYVKLHQEYIIRYNGFIRVSIKTAKPMTFLTYTSTK